MMTASAAACPDAFQPAPAKSGSWALRVGGFGRAAVADGTTSEEVTRVKLRESCQPQKEQLLASMGAEKWQRGQSIVFPCRRCGALTARC
jgi:hypothetical protein